MLPAADYMKVQAKFKLLRHSAHRIEMYLREKGRKQCLASKLPDL